MYRINKVVMIDTRVLRDTSLSLDAKGLFAILSALPEKNYTAEELVDICREWVKESDGVIKHLLRELVWHDYVDSDI